ncbi:MAG TPA: hypothetical protein VMB21_14245 [Candidatus Limnocylindria bacterium]|jgi:hypothetical protein|nr:hypothetical protein [Candidatus Limnocylindria bacterium]
MTAPATTSAAAVTLRNPKELRPHPAIVGMPRWEIGSDDCVAFVEDTREHGIREPAKIHGDLVIDGETHRLAAKQLKMELPCEEVGADEVLAIMLRNLLRRRNLVSKSAGAYLAYPLIAPAREEARQRHLKQLQSGNGDPKSHGVAYGPKLEDFAGHIGVKLTLFKYAAQIHELFAEDAELKAEFEPKILVDGAGLGGLIAGIASHKKTKDKLRGKRAEEQLELFTESWSVLGKRLGYWGKLDVDSRERVLPVLRKTLTAMPEDLRKELARALKDAADEAKEAK